MKALKYLLKEFLKLHILLLNIRDEILLSHSDNGAVSKVECLSG